MYRLLGVLSTLAAAQAGSLRFSPEFDTTWELGGDVVAFNMTCAADRYCAIGFGASKASSDTITCYFLNEVAVCKDEHVGSVPTRPTEDTVQDVTVVDSGGTGDAWWIQFTRALITGDDEDRAIVTSEPQSIIWALGTVVNDSLRKHSSEGRRVVQWAPYFAFNDEFSVTWDVTPSLLIINMTCSEGHYCAIGIGETKTHSDTIICYYAADVVASCEDGHVGGSLTAPTVDGKQDVTVLSAGATTNGGWWLQLSRAWDTSDGDDLSFVRNGTQSILWAIGDVTDGGFRKHSSEGFAVVDWGHGTIVVPEPQVDPFFAFNDEFSVTWKVTLGSLVINMTCSEGHYCAIGIGETKTYSDTIICYYAADVVASCEDGHVGGSLTAPTVDDKQDVTVLSAGGTTNGSWWLQLSRAWDTSDGDDLSFVRDETQSILWAIGDVTDGGFRKHSSEGFAIADWIQGTIVFPEPPQSQSAAPDLVRTPAEHGLITVDSSFKLGIEFFSESTNRREGVPLREEEYTSVRFTFECAAGRYCSLGLNDDGLMVPADAWMCWEDAGTVYCSDWFCTETTACPADASQDIRIEEYNAQGSTWSVTFSRLLDTGDAERDTVISNEYVNFIYATGPSSGASSPVDWHDSFGSIAYDVVSGALTITASGGETWWHIILSLCLLVFLGLASGALILARPSIGYVFQQSYLGSVLSIVFITAALVVIAVGDAGHYSGRVAQVSVVFAGPAQLCIALAFLLRAKILSPCLWLMAMPHERTLVWHRWIGLIGWVFVSLHAIVMYAEFENEPQTAKVLFDKELHTGGTTDGQTTVYPLYGFVSWVAYTILVALGIPFFRRKFYSVFVASHVALSIVTVTFSILHISGGWRPYLINGVPLIILCLDFAARTYQKASKYPVTVSYSGAVTKLVIETGDRKWGPGSYMYISIGKVGFAEAHPFSVVSHHDSGKAVFYVKNMGRRTWSDRLSKLAVDGKEKVFARLEGPYGNLQFDMTKHDKLVLICGGIGITPMLGIAAYMAPEQSALLSWSVRDPSTILFLLEDIEALLAKFANLRIAISYTGHQSLNEADISSSRLTIDHGRPDFKELILTYADERSAVAICGPAPLIMTAVAEAESSHFHLPLHVETFEF
ncbi:Ferric reduction oxidase 7 [Diplonema papillatum]|nr:Ferric reduction oxidase 7 [Diplonema papillatum]